MTYGQIQVIKIVSYLRDGLDHLVVLEKSLESPLDCTEIQPVHSEGDYIKNNWVLRSKGGSATLQLYASIKNESYCIWSYINTWKLTYHELWNTYTLTGYHQFIVVDAWTQYDVSIEKTVYPNGSVTHWGNITYTIEYTNTWKKPLTGFWIRDYWPKQQVQFDRSTPSPTNTGNWEVIGWYFTWPLAPGSGWTITIHGIVN